MDPTLNTLHGHKHRVEFDTKLNTVLVYDKSAITCEKVSSTMPLSTSHTPPSLPSSISPKPARGTIPIVRSFEGRVENGSIEKWVKDEETQIKETEGPMLGKKSLMLLD